MLHSAIRIKSDDDRNNIVETINNHFALTGPLFRVGILFLVEIAKYTFTCILHGIQPPTACNDDNIAIAPFIIH